MNLRRSLIIRYMKMALFVVPYVMSTMLAVYLSGCANGRRDYYKEYSHRYATEHNGRDKADRGPDLHP